MHNLSDHLYLRTPILSEEKNLLPVCEVRFSRLLDEDMLLEDSCFTDDGMGLELPS